MRFRRAVGELVVAHAGQEFEGACLIVGATALSFTHSPAAAVPIPLGRTRETAELCQRCGFGATVRGEEGTAACAVPSRSISNRAYFSVPRMLAISVISADWPLRIA